MPPFAAALALAFAAAPTAQPAATSLPPAGDAQITLATRTCQALAARVDAIPGDAPVLLRSYDDADGRGAPEVPALASAAFSYDNAAAAIALIACGDVPHARRIGNALRDAARHGPVRNAYRAGAAESPPLANGWWDAAARQWREDAYQDGSATGSAAWVALALLQLERATREPSFGDAAAKMSAALAAATEQASAPGGYSGGSIGFDRAPQRIGWRSTEHNIDLIALFDALAQRGDGAEWTPRAAHARAFVGAMWDAPSGHFWIGTLDDGVTINRASSALDAQLWAQLVPQADPSWRSALAYVERAHAVAGGFDFNADRDGAWLEGTAQAALVYRLGGRERDAQPLFGTLSANTASNRMTYATREPRITTGLAAGTAKTADFYYYRLPHLGATAWTALAANGFNPFVPGGGRE